MSLDRAPSDLPGVRYGAVARNEDSRGSFRELWRANAFGAIDPGDAGAAPDARPTFVQANLSTSALGVLRGLHCHERQLDYWVVASGRAFVALVDIRPMLDGRSPTPTVETRVLAEDDWVVIPTGVAHGFLALEPLAAPVPRDQRVRRHRRARLRVGRPRGRRALAVRPGHARRPTDPLRSRPIEPDAGRPPGAPAPHDGLTRTAPGRTGPHGAGPMGLRRPGPSCDCRGATPRRG